MDFAGGQATRGILAITVLEAATIEKVLKGGGKEIAVNTVTEAGEEIVLFAEGVVNANVELVVGLIPFRIGEKVATRKTSVGRGKQIRQFLAERIDGSIRAAVAGEDVGRQSTAVGAERN